MKDVLSASEASKVVGCAPQKMRERLKRGIWNFGTVVTADEAGNELNAYEINKYELASWLHISVEELDKRLNEGVQRHETQIH